MASIPPPPPPPPPTPTPTPTPISAAPARPHAPRHKSFNPPQPQQAFPAYEPFPKHVLPPAEPFLLPDDHRRGSTDSAYDNPAAFSHGGAAAQQPFTLARPTIELLDAVPRTYIADTFKVKHAPGVFSGGPPPPPLPDGPWSPPFVAPPLEFSLSSHETLYPPHMLDQAAALEFPQGLPPPGFAHPMDSGMTSPDALMPPLPLAGALDAGTGQFFMAHEHPRLRTPHACEKCRARKAKCSGDHPVCSRCADRGLACVYAPDKRARGVNKQPQRRRRHRRVASLGLSPGGGERGGEPVAHVAPALTVMDSDAQRLSVDSNATDVSLNRTSASPPALFHGTLGGQALTEANLCALTLGAPPHPPPPPPWLRKGSLAERRRPPPLNLGMLNKEHSRNYLGASTSACSSAASPWERVHHPGAITSPPVVTLAPPQPLPGARARLPSLAYSSGSECAGSPLPRSPADPPPPLPFAPEFSFQSPPGLLSANGAPFFYAGMYGVPMPGYVFPPDGTMECTPERAWPMQGAAGSIGAGMGMGMGVGPYGEEYLSMSADRW